MSASTTQEALVNSKSPTSRESKFLRSPSTLEPDEFQNYVQQEYGAVWGTLKFEDSLSDYSNEVKYSISFNESANRDVSLGSTISLRR